MSQASLSSGSRAAVQAQALGERALARASQASAVGQAVDRGDGYSVAESSQGLRPSLQATRPPPATSLASREIP